MEVRIGSEWASLTRERETRKAAKILVQMLTLNIDGYVNFRKVNNATSRLQLE